MRFPLVLTPDLPAAPRDYPAPHTAVDGPVRGTLAAPDDYSLWLAHARLADRTTLSWPGPHGDEVLYVLDGTLMVDAKAARAGDAVIVESGAPATVTAAGDTTLLHAGPWSPEPVDDASPLGAPAPDGHGTHVVAAAAARDMPSAGADGRIERVVSYYADSTCPTCRATFLRVRGGPWRSRSHTHSQDELIYVTAGRLEFGALTVLAGSLVAVPEHTRYGFKTTGDFEFVNYRRDAAYVHKDPRSEPVLETVDALNAFIDREGAESLH
jgi:quercetin dioxygenase-like cupin family protein